MTFIFENTCNLHKETGVAQLPDTCNLHKETGVSRLPDTCNLYKETGVSQLPDTCNLHKETGVAQLPDTCNLHKETGILCTTDINDSDIYVGSVSGSSVTSLESVVLNLELLLGQGNAIRPLS